MSNSVTRFLSGILLLLGLYFPSLHAQGMVPADGSNYRDSLYHHISCEGVAQLDCYFTYPQGSSDIRYDLRGNSVTLARLDSFIHAALHHPQLHIKRIRLTGYSSIEGTYAHNEALAYSRVESFYHYLRSHYPALYRYPCDRAWVGEDWDGLAKLVRDSRMPERYEVLEIIRNTPVFDGRELLLMRLNDGRPYRYMTAHMFPRLRRVEIKIEYSVEPVYATVTRHTKTPASTVTNDYFAGTDDVFDSERYTSKRERVLSSSTYTPLRFDYFSSGRDRCTYNRIFALKSNLLNWAGVMYDGRYTTPLANISLEWFVSNHWSVEAGAAYSYWHYKSDEKFQGMSGYRIEPRYRFPLITNRLDFYAGVYGRVGDYDLQRSTVTYQDNNKLLDTTGHTGNYWDAGLSTGVHLHLSPAWGMEFGARAGYLSTRGKNYIVENGLNYFDSRRNGDKMKVTDLNVSLVYRFR